MKLFKLLIISCFLFVNGHVMAGLYNFTNRISTVDSAVRVGSIYAEAQVSSSLVNTGTYVTPRRFGYVTFKADHHHGTYFTTMGVEITVRIEKWSGGSYLGDTTAKLSLQYAPDGSVIRDEHSLRIDNIDSYKVIIEGIKVNGSTVTDLPANLVVDLDLFVERYYAYSNAATAMLIDSTALIDLDCDGKSDILRVYWSPSLGIEEYQFEWSFVNDYGTSPGVYKSASNVFVDFKNNSTRVGTYGHYYDISLIYDRGYLCYRVRGLGRDIYDPERTVYGTWSEQESGAVSSFLSSSYLHKTFSYEPTVNWQYTASFAEEGKQKEVISFADGTLRSRQMVTRINTDGNIIVGETVYDHQGRAAIQILPSPVEPSPCSGTAAASLKYYPDFNLSDTDGSKFSAKDFDLGDTLSNSCTSNGGLMSTSSGASRYYSPQNPDQTGINAYIPDAGKRPYSQVEYTDDNTGRVRRQSGMGEGYDLDSGKVTRYYYGTPDDIQMRRLFGNEIGYNSYYQKNMVVDPNGQVSVSYVDNLDRVVATSLAGDVPPNMQGIESSASGDSLETELFTKDMQTGRDLSNLLNTAGNAKEFYQTFTVSTAGNYTFDYNLSFSNFQDSCLKAGICFDCIYDFSIRLEDECGANLLDNRGLERRVGRFSADSTGAMTFYTTCMSTDSTLHENFSVFLGVGSYRLSKTLTVNSEAKYAYLDKYLDTTYNKCLKTIDEFIDEYTSAISYDDCNVQIDCDSCLVLLGTMEDFFAGGGTANDFFARQNECKAMCQTFSYCDIQREMLLADVTPGGQYAEYTELNGQINVNLKHLSVLKTSNSLPKTDADWRHPQIKIGGVLTAGYYGEDSTTRARLQLQVVKSGSTVVSSVPEALTPGDIMEEINGTDSTYFLYPEKLKHVKDFIDSFQTSWAYSLLYYHPEYGFYESCLDRKQKVNPSDTYTSESFEELLMRTDSWDKAVQRGFIKSNYTTFSNPNDRPENWFINSANKPWDPFVVYSTSNYDGFGDSVLYKFNNFVFDYSNQPLSVVEVAAMINRCPTALSSVGYSPNCKEFGMDVSANPALNDSIRNMDWILLKQLYLSLKQTYTHEHSVYQSIHATGTDLLGYNGCIGNNNFSIADDGFAYNAVISTGSSSGEIVNPLQACRLSTYQLYADKTKRFGAADDYMDLAGAPQSVNQSYYLQTGSCPMALNTELLLKDIFANGGLNTSQTDINLYTSFTGFFLNVKDYDHTGAIPAAEYEVSTASSSLIKATVKNAQETLADFTFNKSGSAPFTWADITEISALKPTSLLLINGQTHYSFKLYIKYDNGSNILVDSLEGYTSLNIKTCDLEPKCERNDFLISMQNLMMALSIGGDLTSITPVQVLGGSSPYSALINPLIRQKMGNINATTAYWQLDYVNVAYLLKETPSSPAFLILYPLYSTPVTISPSGPVVLGQTHVQNETYFSLEVLDSATHQKIGEYFMMFLYNDALNNRTPVAIGRCAGPELLGNSCNSEAALNYRDLNTLLKTEILAQKSSFPALNLFANSGLDGIGECVLDYNYTANNVIPSTDTLSYPVAGTIRYRALLDSGLRCPLELQYDKLPGAFLQRDSIIAVGDIIPTGNRQIDGSYTEFLIPFVMTNGGVMVYDTLRGTSCVSIMICETCMDTIYTGGDAFCKEFYTGYLEEYASYVKAQAALLHCEGFEALMPVLSYDEFTDRNLCCYPDDARALLESLIAQLDTTTCIEDTGAVLPACDLFYTSPDVCQEAFYKYVKVLAQYNSSAWAAANNTYLVPAYEEYSTYAAAGKCFCIDYYALYLDAYITAAPSATLPAPQAMDSYGPCPLSIPQGTDTCALMYGIYANKYHKFAQYQNTSGSCGAYYTTVPMLSYQEFTDRGACCSLDTMFMSLSWTFTQLDTSSCPSGQMPYYGTCSGPFETESACVENYSTYLNAVIAYNASAWRISKGKPKMVLYSFAQVADSSFCHCLPYYATYLNTYTTALPNADLPTPNELPKFGYCALPIGEYEEPCEVVYEQYIQYYLDFADNEMFGGSPLCGSMPEMYSYQDFVDNGICCSLDSLAAAYLLFVQSFDEPVTCPSNILPSFTSCPTDLSNSCYDKFSELVNAIRDFNASPYATAYSYTIGYPHSGPLNWFMEDETGQPYNNGGGMISPFGISIHPSVSCNCADTYIQYLQEFTVALPSASLGAPMDVVDFNGCPKTEVQKCLEKYDNYVDCIYRFNSSKSFDYLLTLTKKEFTEAGVCDCVDDYCFYLSDMTLKYGKLDTKPPVRSIFEFCHSPYSLVPCATGSFPVIPDSLPVYVPEDFCAAILDGVAVSNAYNAYNQYLAGLKQQFLKDYDARCMQTVENMRKKYFEREYHYTLYYYDQAGSLIRTVPPEGVQPLAFSSPDDALYVQLGEDLLNGTHTVLTDHKMATTYEYNSLGQLIRQTTPDHDQMDIWELQYPNGLHRDLKVSAIQMVTENTGYLAGNLSSGSIQRGLFYKTVDGGQNWSRVSSIVTADLKKVTFPRDGNDFFQTGYAIGSDGILLKSVDGGNSWDLLNTFSLGQVLQFEDISFESQTTGIIACADGTIVKTTDGGTTFSSSSLTLPAGITGSFVKLKQVVKQAGTDAFYTVTLNQNGTFADAVLKETSGTFSWVPFHGSDFGSISFYSDTAAYIGAGNLLLHVTYPVSGDPVIRTVDAQLPGFYNDIIFLDKNTGIVKKQYTAANSTGILFYTLDGGIHWDSLAPEGHIDFIQLNVVKRTADYVIIHTPSYGSHLYEVVLHKNGAPTYRRIISDAQAQVGNQQGYIIISSDLVSKSATEHYLTISMNDGYYSQSRVFDNTTESIDWNYHFDQIDDIDAGLSNRYMKFQSVVLAGEVHAIGLTYNNQLHHLKAPFGGAFTVLSKLSSDAGYYRDFAFDKANGAIYTVNVNDRKFYKYTLASQTLAAVSSTALSSAPDIVNSYRLDYRNGKILMASKNGEFASVTGIGSTPAVLEHSAIYASSANVLHINASNRFVAGINNGKFADYNSSQNRLNIASLGGSTGNVNDITSTGTYFFFAGDNTLAYVWETSTWTVAKVNYNENTSTPFEQVFPGINFKRTEFASNTLFLYAAENLYFHAVMVPGSYSFSKKIPNTGSPVSSLAASSMTGKIIASFENGALYTIDAVSGTMMRNTSVYSTPIADLHFTDADNGTVVGASFFVRKTSSAGAVWQKIKPSNSISTQVAATIRKVWTTPSKTAILVGTNYVGRLTGNYVTYDAFTGDIRDINFRTPVSAQGYIATTQSIREITHSGGTSSLSVSFGTTTSITATDTINAIHVFENQNVMAVGTASLVKLFNKASSTVTDLRSNIPASKTLNDVFFHDDYNGYVLGNNGVFYRSANVSLHPTNYGITGLQWLARENDLAASYDANSNDKTLVHLKAISFGSRFNGVFGGEMTASYINPNNKGYARKLKDETGQYGTNFYYDRLGRIVASRNARQYKEDKYSYTLYDALGRVVEAGEKTENTGLFTVKFAYIFGTEIGGQLIPSVVDDTKLALWIAGNGPRKEVTHSYYDTLHITGLPPSFPDEPHTQRNRIVHVSYEELYDGNDQTYDHATHYAYDIHGNVKVLLQDKPSFESDPLLSAQRFKRLDYQYDLVSGNVHRVDFQTGKVDEWHHAYHYDADNRITAVFTTGKTPLADPLYGMRSVQQEPEQSPFWKKDAAYFYYKHGPLARVETGHEKVQGTDYVYTVQGWIKGVNANTLDETKDPGKDATGYRPLVAKDVFAYSLHYNNFDYKSIAAGAGDFLADQAGSDLLAAGTQLYNGNIGQMVTTITNPTTRDVLPLGNGYKYDQLNRLKESKSFVNLSGNSWGNAGSYDNKYFNKFTYDANGNILTQVRHDSTGTKIDDLAYKYERNFAGRLLRNRLYHVNDVVLPSLYSDDIDDMGTFEDDINFINTDNNYAYDGEGRLVKDKQEEIDSILWRVDGKVKMIIRTPASQKNNLSFDYDAMGRRTAKHIMDLQFNIVKSTYYILDATGNVMSTYDYVVDTLEETTTFIQREKYIYGSSRLGMLQDSVDVLGSAYVDTQMDSVTHTIGNKRYEFNNHLGNVLTTISDKPIPHNNGGSVDYFLADIKTAQDYSPFGVTLSGRYFGEDSKYGMNGQEKEREITSGTYSAEFWMYESRLARRWNLDPKPNISISGYAAFVNSPISFSDPYGDTVKFASQKARDLYNNYKAEVQNRFNNAKGKDIDIYKGILGELSALEKSQDIFRIRTDEDFDPQTAPGGGDGGNIAYNKNTEEIDINVKLSGGGNFTPTQRIAHELKHGDQFLKRKLNFKLNGSGGYAYDQTDEIEAFQRQNLFAEDLMRDYIDPYRAASQYSNRPSISIVVSSSDILKERDDATPTTAERNYLRGTKGRRPSETINAGDIPAYKKGRAKMIENLHNNILWQIKH